MLAIHLGQWLDRRHQIRLLRLTAEMVPDLSVLHVSVIPRDWELLRPAYPSQRPHRFRPRRPPHFGFHYAVLDRELGEQALAASSPMSYREDPSLWATIELATE